MQTVGFVVLGAIFLYVTFRWWSRRQLTNMNAKLRRDACIRRYLHSIRIDGNVFRPLEEDRIRAVDSVPPLEAFKRDVHLGEDELKAEFRELFPPPKETR